MPRVIHFEIPVDDADRAVAFYERAFGWRIQKWGGPADYWLIDSGDAEEPGINGALTLRSSAEHVVNTIGVPSYDEYLAKVEAAGGKALTPKMTVPGVGYMAYCLDTEGNVFGIMQTDESAA